MSESTGAHGDDQPKDPMAEMLRQLGINLGPNGQIDLNQLMARLQQQMGAFTQTSASGSGVNWEQTRHAARQVAAGLGPDPSITSQQQREVADAERLANLWLDEACDFGQVSTSAVAWSRAEWIEQTMPAWEQVTEPIVAAIARAMGEMMGGQAPQLPPELGAFGAMMQPMLRQAAGAMYSMQLAQAIAKVSSEVVTGSEIGFQLLKTPRAALLPTNIDAFSEGLEVTGQDVLLYLMLRESARQRLFQQVGWLAPQILALVEHYAREIRIDADALEGAIDLEDMSQLTPEKMAEISEDLQGKLFEPTQTAEQVEILGRLETLLALVEGWVDEVVAQATARWMPNSSQLAETLRRRRAAGGPAEDVLKSLVGLELRPRRVRDAANLWAALSADRGVGGRDAVWNHPDLVPTAADLDDPLGYVSGENTTPAEADDLDAELAKLLDEEGRTED
ncbi:MULTISPECIES: zinc-dependent metalloprotease [unclassified Luteococcus]|uniref:zinc-dependent metalloprotease n=1 Tax=unclassified Luteococcus TaxID=2639923 RepID=UPI00313E0B09